MLVEVGLRSKFAAAIFAPIVERRFKTVREQARCKMERSIVAFLALYFVVLLDVVDEFVLYGEMQTAKAAKIGFVGGVSVKMLVETNWIIELYVACVAR